MREKCKVCGRRLEEGDNIGWRYFGMICGCCFLPCAEYVVENIYALEAISLMNQIAPGIYGEA